MHILVFSLWLLHIWVTRVDLWAKRYWIKWYAIGNNNSDNNTLRKKYSVYAQKIDMYILVFSLWLLHIWVTRVELWAKDNWIKWCAIGNQQLGEHHIQESHIVVVL
jgi:hypothetical protein